MRCHRASGSLTLRRRKAMEGSQINLLCKLLFDKRRLNKNRLSEEEKVLIAKVFVLGFFSLELLLFGLTAQDEGKDPEKFKWVFSTSGAMVILVWMTTGWKLGTLVFVLFVYCYLFGVLVLRRVRHAVRSRISVLSKQSRLL